ncbi:MAG: hypothetical protein QF893_03115 [Alphaproteobacteria bacterium]|jgi:hypothetical protein|nr:hypothetical protein [Alphaproteobacteria bacterium]
MQEKEAGLGALSAIDCDFKVQEYREAEDGFFCNLLIAEFAGEYGHGARGNDDGVFMTAMLRAGFSAWAPWVLVLDLAELRYEWGDMMESALRAGEDYRPWDGGLATAVVASPLNEAALRSLIDNVIGDDPDDWLRPSRDAAIAFALDKWRAKSPSG